MFDSLCTSRRWMICLLLLVPGSAGADAIGPSSYLCFDTAAIAGCAGASSPFSALDFSTGYFVLENFEDGSLTQGVSTNGSLTVFPDPNQVDSVDEDDGAIDGVGSGRSWVVGNCCSGPGTLYFEFDEAILGAYPTHAALVWTDGMGQTTFEAFDASGVSLGIVGPVAIADGSFDSSTGEDHFFGWIHAGGISRIEVRQSGSGVEVDHLQFGRQVVSVPTLGAVQLGILAVLLTAAAASTSARGNDKACRTPASG